MALAPETLLHDRYRIEEILGQGGMGSIYRAKDETLGIEVAVKENLYLTDEYIRQFQKEATILARVKHGSLPRVIDYFLIPNQGQYLVMDFIPGEDLRDRIERMGKVPEKEIALIGALICEALDYLHKQDPPIIHRDIKPGNIRITPEGTIALVDFGLAKFMVENQQTTTGARAMTPGYSPPEQYGTAPTDGRTDIYSLGATLYAALTGIIPEDGIGRATGRYELTPVRELDPSVNRKLAAALEKSMELKPEARYQDPLAFRSDLLAGMGIPESASTTTISPAPASTAASENSVAPESVRNDSKPLHTVRYSQGRKKARGFKAFFRDPKWVLLTTLGLLAVIFLAKAFADSRLSPPLIETPTPTFQEPLPTHTIEPTIPAVTPSEMPAVIPTMTEEPTATFEVKTVPPTPQIEKGLIAFASDRTGTMEIWLMRKDGSNQRVVTNLPDGACQPAWDPTGTQLAFISPCHGFGDTYPGAKIFIVDLVSGAPPRELNLPASPSEDFDPAWSPKGDRIAFASTRSGNIDIFTFNLMDGTLQQLTASGYLDRSPAWAPSGNMIAYAHKATHSQIWLMTDSGHNKVRLDISGEIDSENPVWTPDGNHFVFTVAQRLASMRYEDRGTNRVTRIPAPGQPDIFPVKKPSISPDGKSIIYEGWPAGTNHDIYVATINGSNPVRLTTDKDYDINPVWQP